MWQAIFNVTLGGAYKNVPQMAMKRETESFFEKWRFNLKIDNIWLYKVQDIKIVMELHQ
jgi:hypothetical protein